MQVSFKRHASNNAIEIIYEIYKEHYPSKNVFSDAVC